MRGHFLVFLCEMFCLGSLSVTKQLSYINVVKSKAPHYLPCWNRRLRVHGILKICLATSFVFVYTKYIHILMCEYCCDCRIQINLFIYHLVVWAYLYSIVYCILGGWFLLLVSSWHDWYILMNIFQQFSIIDHIQSLKITLASSYDSIANISTLLREGWLYQIMKNSKRPSTSSPLIFGKSYCKLFMMDMAAYMRGGMMTR